MRLRPEDLTNLDAGWSRAIEMVATPAIFAVLGFLVDRWIGTTPLFTIALAVLAVVGAGASTWYRYDNSMKQLEDDFAARRDGTAGKSAA